MKIEKLNDFQIRCTLNAQDLKEKQLGITDIAFCSDKAKSLFRDMMQHAARDYGFVIPSASSLMVELRATSPDDLVLTITCISGPEDMSRFLSGTAFKNQGPVFGGFGSMAKGGNTSYMEKYKSLFEKALSSGEAPAAADREQVRSFRFDSLDDAISASKAVGGEYEGINSLYRFGSGNNYQLLLHYDKEKEKEYTAACGIISEYGLGLTCTEATENYLKEHGGLILENEAIRILAGM